MKTVVTIKEDSIVVHSTAIDVVIALNTGLEIQPMFAKHFAKWKEEVKTHGHASHPTGKPSRAHTGIKTCQKCGKEYKPTSNAQRFCQNCTPHKPRQNKKILADMDDNELDKTLKEIEQRRKQPYEFS